jgi:potassium uptake TrkH family protein
MKKSGKRLNLRERIYKRIFVTSDKFRVFFTWVSGLCRFCFTISFFLFVLGSIFYIGFANSPENLAGLKSAFRILFLLMFISKYTPELLQISKPHSISALFRLSVFLYCLFVFLSNFRYEDNARGIWPFFNGSFHIASAIVIMGISEISGLFPRIRNTKIPPALVFSLSFAVIILAGSGLLMLPNSHTGSLSYLDSLFTSVSAVCVTGLVTVDIASTFTLSGKIIILCLIQIGGLGIMTFTGFFSYIFTSQTSFSDRLLLKELFSSESLNNLFKILTKIILLTFLIELTGTLFIYTSLDNDFPDRIFFSFFHSVSGFCNAGFSTMKDNIADVELRNNSILQISLVFLIILGGLGFPVLMSFYSSLKHKILILIRKIQRRRIPVKPEQRNIPTHIVLFMTSLLILGGATGYYLLESGTTLKGVDTGNRIITSLFGSVSARTAGFNIMDISLWSYPTVFLMIGLMWIGASPGSTGGGIKTTTFALALRAAWNTIRGGESLKIGNREIGHTTIKRVLTIIFLSLLVIGGGFFSLLVSEPGKNPSYLLFECVSAYSTVGLSMVNSSSLSEHGKVVDIILMFTGRVGPLTLLAGFFTTYRIRYASYPEIDIVIN